MKNVENKKSGVEKNSEVLLVNAFSTYYDKVPFLNKELLGFYDLFTSYLYYKIIFFALELSPLHHSIFKNYYGAGRKPSGDVEFKK